MDLYGRPALRKTSTPAVAFLNERTKSLSFSSGFNPPGMSHGRSEDDESQNMPQGLDRLSSNQQQQNQQQHPPLLHQRPASSRFLNRPQSSSGVRRPEAAFPVPQEVKQRPRTAREGGRGVTTTHRFAKRTSSFTTQGTEISKGPEVDSRNNGDEDTELTMSLDEQYLQQLKADILHLHHVHRQLENEALENDKTGDRIAMASTSQAPNHVKNLLINRDTKTYLGWNSKSNPASPFSTASIQTQLLRYNYSTDSAQLTAAKVGLEGLLADTLVSLMEFCLDHNDSESEGSSDPDRADTGVKAFKMMLLRAPVGQNVGDMPSLPFANGCGTNSASIYAGGILSVLQQTEVLKRTMLAATGERKVLVKVIADKDAELKQLTEQIGFFKDVLARRRPRFERIKRVQFPYEEGDQGDAPVSAENGYPQETNPLVTEQLARLAALEKDRVESILSIQNLERQRDELQQQLEKATSELHAAAERLETAEQLHQESMIVASNSFQEQVETMEKRSVDLQNSLASMVEQYRSLEDSANSEKVQLRRDKLELERLMRLKEDEIGQRRTQITAKAEAQAQAATVQLQLVTTQLNQAQQALDELRLELKTTRTDTKQAQGTVRSLHHDLKVRNEDVERLTAKLAAVTTTSESKTALLQQSEARIEVTSKELERQQVLLEEQAHHVQLLEAKLSRSVPVDDEELQSRQQREESAWHQRVSALEHALVAERQNTALFREQQRKALAMEQEKAVHAVEQAQAVAAELATANLCLLERKRQREQEQKTSEEKLKEYTDRVASLSSDRDDLERELDALRRQHEQLRLRNERCTEEATTTKKVLQEELASVKEELKNLTEIRENLDRALAHALASPRGKSVRHQTSLSELRAELQKAKQKITTLEEQLSHHSSIRTSEIESKLAQLSATERRVAEEQRGLKKQRTNATSERLQIEQELVELDRQREAVESKQKIDHELLQHIITLLAQRLQVMMALFDTVLIPASSQAPRSSTSETAAVPNLPVNTASNDVSKWREVQQKWEALRQDLERVDWKLSDMRSRLEALHLEYLGYALAPVAGEQSSRSQLLAGFHGPNPFSDAVAAGRDTVSVAEQLKASRLLRRLSCPGDSFETRVRQVKAEEHETFALALAREMAAMKESYARQLDELRGELRKTQQLRLLTSQRLRAELTAECTHNQRAKTQLSERVAELEAALVAQDQTLATAQTQQRKILDELAAATSDGERQRALQDLAALVGGEQRRRERERLAKLLAYCGASSVTVECRDSAVEEETVDAVLERIARGVEVDLSD
ncbi:hypothetical protein PR002_g16311 [Phytophthora rubi]|uniref:Uncharacterized protein n=1 Tax=Phytophthora rubi TaxID=129364 RepID=A0A6A3KJT3_9STRA|nr:hypothetical protein PR002_g16311 [Phytophthora rubi]